MFLKNNAFFAYVVAIISSAAIASAILAVLWLTVLSPTTSGDVLVAVEPKAAMFDAREGETVSAEFTVRNASDEPLRLIGIRTSCNCLVVEHELPLDLKPGQSTVLVLQMIVGKPANDGRFIQRAHLYVNRVGVVPALIISTTVLTDQEVTQ